MSYAERQQARKARLKAKAQRLQRQSEALSAQGHQMADRIPFGQPVLVGHHSEGKDRRYRGKIHALHERAHSLAQQAEHYAERAESVGKGGISSDDEGAVEKLRAKLEGLEELQRRMRAVNAAIRRGKTEAEQRANLEALGASGEAVARALTPDRFGRVGFHDYQLKNNGANIRRVRERLETLERLRERQGQTTRQSLEESEAGELQEGQPQRGETALEGDAVSYREDVGENRVLLIFPGKPSAEVRAELKAHGFKWSPSRSAWVRLLNNQGIYWGKHFYHKLNGLPEAV